MQYQYIEAINLAKRLSEVHSDDDIIQLSNAIFPGTHCPLFGALMVASYVKGLAVLNIGTQECTYYGKAFSRMRQNGQDQMFSLVAHKNDITFGFKERIEESVRMIVKTFNPDAILLISTCVVELIGEDVASVVEGLEKEIHRPVLFVKTEHFKCNSHIPGISDTIQALIKLMIPSERQPKTVNILGHRFDDFDKSEFAKIMKDSGIYINLSIPSSCSVESLKTAGLASLNIVTDFTALPIAKAMEEKLGQPYVVFEKHMLPDRIKSAYDEVASHLGIEWDKSLKELYEEAVHVMHSVTSILRGKSFVYGNAPVKALEMTHFLAVLGMEPLWVQMRELYDDDADFSRDIFALGYDPKISRIANIIPMRDVYDLLKPDLYIGHENPMELMSRGIKQLTLDKEVNGLGFQLSISIMKKLHDSFETGGLNPAMLAAMRAMAHKGGER